MLPRWWSLNRCLCTCVCARAQRKRCICSEQHHIKYTRTLHAASAWIHSSPPALTVVWGREAGPLRREGRSLCGQTGQSHAEGWVLRQQKRKTHLFSLLRTRWNVMVWSPTSPRRGISERKEPTKVISWRGGRERGEEGGKKAALPPLGLRSSVDELVRAVSAAASRSVRVSDVPSCGYTDAVFIYFFFMFYHRAWGEAAEGKVWLFCVRVCVLHGVFVG